MLDRIERKIEPIQIPAGYVVSAGLSSTPLWLQDAATWFEFGIVVCGFLIGVTTLWLNIRKILKNK